MLNRLLLPGAWDNDEQLREAAASVRADLLLAYTIATDQTIDNHSLDLLELVTLGLLPIRAVNVNATASAVLFDVRTGFVYGLAEATASDGALASLYTQCMAAENAQADAMRDALNRLVGNVWAGWPGYLANAGLDTPGQEPPVISASQP